MGRVTTSVSVRNSWYLHLQMVPLVLVDFATRKSTKFHGLISREIPHGSDNRR